MNDPQTNAIMRRSGDSRTRNRRVPVEVPTGNDQKMAKAAKYYCPACGQVRRVALPFLSRNPAIVGDQVMPHEFSTGARQLEYCPGGTFDPEKDAA